MAVTIFYWQSDNKPLFFAVHGPMQSWNYVVQSFNSGDFGSVVTSVIRYILFIVFGEIHEARLYYSLILLVSFSIWLKIVKLFTKSRLATVAIPLFAILSPLYYERLILGHHKLLIAFSLMSLALAQLVRIIREEKVDNKQVLYAVVASLLAILLSNHTLPLIAIFVFFVIIIYWKQFQKIFIKLISKKSINNARWIYFAILILTIINIFGLINSFNISQNYSDLDLKIFSPIGDYSFGVLVNVFAFSGLWIKKGIQEMFSSGLWLFPIFTSQVITLSYLLKIWKEERRLAAVIIVVFFISFIFALGINSVYSFISIPFQFLFESGIFKGLRESTKFLHLAFIPAVISLTLAFDYFSKKHKKLMYLLALSLLAVVAINLFSVIKLGQGRIAECEYPPIALQLQKDIPPEEKILLVPESTGDYYNFCDIYTHNVFMLFANKPVVMSQSLDEEIYWDANTLDALKETYRVQHILIIKTKFQNYSIEKSHCKVYAEDEYSIRCSL